MNEKNLELAIDLRHKLHKYPELSNEEKMTKETLMDFLRYHTSLEVVDKGKWFYAVYYAKNRKGNIAFRTDFDAIKVLEEMPLNYCSVNKGVSHKCGHDGHSAALAALALEINEKGADKDIFFIFQHAEETGDGGEAASQLITEKNIEEVYAFHNLPGAPFGSLGVRVGTICYASLGVELSFTGISSHASEPEKGKNPAYTIAKIVDRLPIFSQDSKYKGLVLATIVQIEVGQRAFGVSAHRGKLLLTVRAQFEQELKGFLQEIENFAKEISCEEGLGIEIQHFDVFPETVNHRESVEKIYKIAENKGWTVNQIEALRTSEDFGYFLKKTKGSMIWIGAGEEWPALHSFEFDFNDKLIVRVVELFQELIKI